jgi:hypothetical protein
MAGNLIVSDSTRLITVFTEPVGMIWRSNMADTGMAGSLGYDTPPSGILVADPLLVYQTALWRLSPGSPAIDAADTAFKYITQDIEGQPRDAVPDIGADEFSDQPAERKILTSGDVGPFAHDIIDALPVYPPGQSLPVPLTIDVAPNPFNSTTSVTVRLERPSKIDLDLYDIRGRVIYRKRVNPASGGRITFTIGSEDLCSGVYFLNIRTPEISATRKICVVK